MVGYVSRNGLRMESRVLAAFAIAVLVSGCSLCFGDDPNDPNTWGFSDWPDDPNFWCEYTDPNDPNCVMPFRDPGTIYLNTEIDGPFFVFADYDENDPSTYWPSLAVQVMQGDYPYLIPCFGFGYDGYTPMYSSGYYVYWRDYPFSLDSDNGFWPFTGDQPFINSDFNEDYCNPLRSSVDMSCLQYLNGEWLTWGDFFQEYSTYYGDCWGPKFEHQYCPVPNVLIGAGYGCRQYGNIGAGGHLLECYNGIVDLFWGSQGVSDYQTLDNGSYSIGYLDPIGSLSDPVCRFGQPILYVPCDNPVWYLQGYEQFEDYYWVWNKWQSPFFDPDLWYPTTCDPSQWARFNGYHSRGAFGFYPGWGYSQLCAFLVNGRYSYPYQLMEPLTDIYNDPLFFDRVWFRYNDYSHPPSKPDSVRVTKVDLVPPPPGYTMGSIDPVGYEDFNVISMAWPVYMITDPNEIFTWVTLDMQWIKSYRSSYPGGSIVDPHWRLMFAPAANQYNRLAGWGPWNWDGFETYIPSLDHQGGSSLGFTVPDVGYNPLSSLSFPVDVPGTGTVQLVAPICPTMMDQAGVDFAFWRILFRGFCAVILLIVFIKAVWNALRRY